VTAVVPSIPPRSTPPQQASAYRLKGLLFFVPFSVAMYALGVWGFMAADPGSSCHAASLDEAAFRSLQLVAHSGSACTGDGRGVPAQLVVAQMVLPLLLALGTVFAAVKIVLANLRHDAQLALVQTLRGHTVICGLGKTGLEAVRQLALAQGKTVAVTLDPQVDAARFCESLGVPLITGDATLRKTLATAGLAHARAAVICTGSDALNLEICLAIDGMKHRAGAELMLFPEIRGSWLLGRLTEQQAPIVGLGLQLHPFQANEAIARKLLRQNAFTGMGQMPRLLFIGFGELAQAILRRTVLSNAALPGSRIIAGCLDADPPAWIGAEPPDWCQLLDLTATVHKFGQDEAADGRVLRQVLEQGVPDAVIITLADDGAAMRVATLLRTALDLRSCFATPIFIRVKTEKRLCGLLGSMASLPFCPHRFSGFGDLGEVVAPESLFDETLDNLARALHESYLAHSTGASPARQPWARLPERYRRANREAADHIPVKLAYCGYAMLREAGPSAPLQADALECMGAAEHYRWSLSLQAAGWRAGAARSDLLKIHPLLLPWDELPEAVREDNRRQIEMIPGSLALAGFRLKRIVPVPAGAVPALDGTDLPCFELDAGTPAGWPEAEAALAAVPGITSLRLPRQFRAEALRELAEKYPHIAAATNIRHCDFKAK